MQQGNSIRTLLIVDDSRISRMMIRALVLVRYPQWIVMEAASGNEALEIVERDVPNYCTMDINMPGLVGTVAAERMLGKHPDIRIAIFSANIQEVHQARAVTMGARFVEKPVTEKSVARALEFFESAT